MLVLWVWLGSFFKLFSLWQSKHLCWGFDVPGPSCVCWRTWKVFSPNNLTLWWAESIFKIVCARTRRVDIRRSYGRKTIIFVRVVFSLKPDLLTIWSNPCTFYSVNFFIEPDPAAQFCAYFRQCLETYFERLYFWLFFFQRHLSTFRRKQIFSVSRFVKIRNIFSESVKVICFYADFSLTLIHSAVAWSCSTEYEPS